MSEAENVAVMYVGKKRDATDNMAGSGMQWRYRGDVQLISMAAAQKLCNFPDQWWADQGYVPSQEEVDGVAAAFAGGDRSVLKDFLEPEEEAEVEVVDVAKAAATTGDAAPAKATTAKKKPAAKRKAAGKKGPTKVAPPVKAPTDVYKMDEKQLRAYAKKEHSTTFKATMSLKKMREEVDALNRERAEQEK